MSGSLEPDVPDLPVALDRNEYRDRLRDLPPSAKLVAKVLEGSGPCSHGRLAEESLLPERTVRHAIERLEDAGLVRSRASYRDARRRIYELRAAMPAEPNGRGKGQF